MKKFGKRLLIVLISISGLWLIAEIIMRAYVELPLTTDFYASIPREDVSARQAEIGLRASSGAGWIHLGWIADPEHETYRVERLVQGTWSTVGEAQFGSYLAHESGSYRVFAEPKDETEPQLIGEVNVEIGAGDSPIFTPRINGEWQALFKPEQSGDYINDHTIYQDNEGNWQLIGITSKTDGDYNQEKYFATATSSDFPPDGGMTETQPIADFGELAWAPDVILAGDAYHLLWSPHKLHQMESQDGIEWNDHTVTMPAPFHKFFRDAMVIQVAEDQWLLYTTSRGAYYSRVDLYQSFDMKEWQYIGPALDSGIGSERNSPFSSMESPFVIDYKDHYYLSLTYNNDSFFYSGVLMLFKIWLNPESYNDTLVFHSDNPYDFGVYRGQYDAPTLLTEFEAHAPEYVYNPDTDAWFVTTAGWPWVATLTSGEVAVAPLEWLP